MRSIQGHKSAVYIVILRGPLYSCRSPYDSVISRYVKAWPGGRLELSEYSAVEDE
jgi:hypothetical protein